MTAVHQTQTLPSNYIFDTVIHTLISSVAGALAGRITQIISPHGGALFGVVTQSVNCSVERFHIDVNKKNSIIMSVAIITMGTLASIYAGRLVLNMAGYTVTAKQSEKLYFTIVYILFTGRIVVAIAKLASYSFNQYFKSKTDSPK